MGAYEERYPEAYGRGIESTRVRTETPATGTAVAPERRPLTGIGREAPQPARDTAPEPARERHLFDWLRPAGERVRAWQHRPAETPAPVAAMAETTAPPYAAAPIERAPAPIATPAAAAPTGGGALFRGRGPRGYVRRPDRIREDLCDRLTENPFIDASDIEVAVDGSEITLTGTVDSMTAFNQVDEIANEVIGATRVHNRLAVRSRNDGTAPTPGDRVNAAMPPPR